MGLFGKNSPESCFKKFVKMVGDYNSAEGKKKESIAAQLDKELAAIDDICLINRVMSKIDHMAWPNREEQIVGQLFNQRANAIIGSINDVQVLRELDAKISKDTEKTTAWDTFLSNTLSGIIQQYIKLILKPKTDQERIKAIEDWLTKESYGVPGEITEILEELTDTKALSKYSFDVGGEVFNSFALKRLEHIAHSTSNIVLLKLIAEKAKSAVSRENAKSKVSKIEKKRARCAKSEDWQHVWNECKCEKCGTVRDGYHKWENHACSVCGTADFSCANETLDFFSKYTSAENDCIAQLIELETSYAESPEKYKEVLREIRAYFDSKPSSIPFKDGFMIKYVVRRYITRFMQTDAEHPSEEALRHIDKDIQVDLFGKIMSL